MDYKQGYLDGWLQCHSMMGSMLFVEKASAAEAFYTTRHCWFRLCDLFEDESYNRLEKFTEEDCPFFFRDRPYKGIKEQCGWIYVVRADNGMYKIGQTTKLDNRIKQLGIKLPYELQVVCTLWTDHVLIAEETLHERYKEKRVRGEWFALDDEDIVEIKAEEFFMVADQQAKE